MTVTNMIALDLMRPAFLAALPLTFVPQYPVPTTEVNTMTSIIVSWASVASIWPNLIRPNIFNEYILLHNIYPYVNAKLSGCRLNLRGEYKIPILGNNPTVLKNLPVTYVCQCER